MSTMENEKAAPSDEVAENVNGVDEEVSKNSSQPIEPTKRSLRVETWKKIQENKLGVRLNTIFNRIPYFLGSEKPGVLLAQTEEFKNAQNIKVNIDRTLNGVKSQTLLAHKTLYLPAMRDSNVLFLRANLSPDATEEETAKILYTPDAYKHREQIYLEDKVKLDMVVIGSVRVSRDGYRIGRGNGFTDLDIGLLIEVGSITPETVIVTVVHDIQVDDHLPTNLFQKFDTPVDMIVTPTEVIRVANRLPRPKGIYWDILSERRLKIIPVLRLLKEQLEKEGKIITLKDEDTDIEQNQNRNRRRGPIRHGKFPKRTQRRAISQTDTEQQVDNQQPRRNLRRPHRYINQRRRPTKSEGDQSGVESKSQERKPHDKKQQQQQQRPRKNRWRSDFCVKLTNISRGVRIKDLKSELRRRNCVPTYISWKAYFGTCYLHYANRNFAANTDKVLEMLSDLSLKVADGQGGSDGEGDTPTKTVKVNVEVIKFDEKKGPSHESNDDGVGSGGDTAGTGARIECVDTTTV